MNNNNVQRVPAEQPHMGQLKTANHLLGDREALKRAWERDGYWYFKDVLDKGVIGEMRKLWIDYLQRKGLIDSGVEDNRYNGSGFADKDLTPAELSRVSEFNERNIHTMLTENPKIIATMKELLGDDPFWLPIAEYRANPPVDDPAASRFIYPHQDGFYSRDMEMKICWIPLDYVDDQVGGCAWIEGAHRGPILHDLSKPPLFPIPTEVVPIEGWKRADFGPGDIVIFDLNLPHSGLTNISKDRFRLSMDIRVTEASGKVPSIGSVLGITEDRVTLRNDRTGAEESYAIEAGTYVRGTDGKKREGAQIPQTFRVGERVIVNSRNGQTATLVRSIH
ncbi:phytanoyl-CoA dioxygenase family protein [Pseudomonas citronellolis]|uniref:phytanoyl-CoA dioxygenase family protein n=1 Tax=Pseudomonas citronellolis TaxID=53408 RepID=UPI0021BFAD95|nr:phytanoyl-CoA dioxygenase family protein [Pseudomonas citronellolis]UXJ50233.1 phytanoyl-CoA dioxygenase family protein [Pseudomonas citronellolis]